MANPYKTKLSKEQCKQITILNGCGIRYHDLVKEFGVCTATISHAKKRADVDEAYKKVNGHKNSFRVAIETYNSTQDDFIKQKIQEHIFSPIINKFVENYSIYGFYPKLDNHLKLWHAIFGKTNWGDYEVYSPKVKLEEIKQIVSEEISKASSEKDLAERVHKKVSEKYSKSFPDNLKGKINNAINTLTQRQQKVLILRYGLKDGTPRTLEEVGKIFYVTRDRIRQIEAGALKDLRHPTRSRNIGEIGAAYERYLKSNPNNYEGKEKLESILDNLLSVLENKEGSLERSVLGIFKKHKEDLNNYCSPQNVSKSLYINLSTFLISYLSNLEKKIDSALIASTKNLSPKEKDELLNETAKDTLGISELKNKLSTPISEFELSIRSSNCLREANIRQIGDLVQKTEAEMLKYRNFGKKSLGEVQNILKGMRLSLGMKDLPKYK